MSEYQEKFSVTRLIGSPPGYVGYDEGGQLTEAVRRKPYSVLLFDEIEKAHPDVFNVLLQVLDDGRLTDNKGRTVNFKNTIIIMTSNLGSPLIRERTEQMTEANRADGMERLQGELMELLKQTIRPEFLNRIDEVILFTPLNRTEIRQIVKLQFELVQQRLEKSGFHARITDQAIDWIAEAGFDPQFGARPVKRMMQKFLLNDLSKEILSGTISKESEILVDTDGNHLVFRS
jgi:ATP-dependent Clp protease ATP-binding subunit ClpB